MSFQLQNVCMCIYQHKTTYAGNLVVNEKIHLYEHCVITISCYVYKTIVNIIEEEKYVRDDCGMIVYKRKYKRNINSN